MNGIDSESGGSPRMAKKALGWVLVLLAVLLVGCDHATKLVAHQVLANGRSVELLPGMLDLRYHQNDDTAFSLLHVFHVARSTLLLGLVSGGAATLVMALWWRRRHVATSLEGVGYAMVTAGAIGNVADRLVRGYVVDFIHLHHWPTFNVADVAIVIGAGLLMIAFWKNKPTVAAS